MASYLQVENISKSYGTKVLFDKISFNINEGDKIALIAPNGTGKTSLLSILAGKDSSDSGGSIKFLKDISIAFLEQDYKFNQQNTVFEEVFSKSDDLYSVVREYEAALSSDNHKRIEKAIGEMDRVDGWKYEQNIKQILTSLKLSDLNQKMSSLSGGEVKRVALAELLLRNADFLVLDEPTNHLDIEVIEFLEEYLKKSKCTLFMVTHDRYFLDRVCNTILELDGGNLYTYKGNYSYFLEKREERIANFVAETDKAKNILRRELEWIRSTPCARSGKAKYRIDAFYDLQERAQGRVEEKKVRLNVQSARLGKKIIDCHNVSHYFGERCMLDSFSYNFQRFEKVGIVGNNAVGKSTFLDLITGAIKPTSGEIDPGETIVFGYYHQNGINFKPEQTVFDVVHDIAEIVTLGDGNKISVSAFLNYFLFPPSTHYTKIEKLSGGEKRRLYLLTVLMKNPNFLILDEPTNDLDILTLNVLEDYLADFRGCVLIVSHDRYFLDKLADHLFIFQGEGKVKDYVGKCSEYRQYMKDLQAQQMQPIQIGRASKSGISANDSKKSIAPANGAISSESMVDDLPQNGLSSANSNCPDASQSNSSLDGSYADSASTSSKGKPSLTPQKKKLSYKEQKEYEQLEKDIDQLTKEKKLLEEQLSGGTLSIEELTKASERIGIVIEELDTKEMRWFELWGSIND